MMANGTSPAPRWVRRLAPWLLVAGGIAVWWAPGFAPGDAPSTPCPTISRSQFEAALAAGATRGTAVVQTDGSIATDFGPGVVSCATLRTSSIKPCKRPDDLVVRMTDASNPEQFVKVAAGNEYRFRTAGGKSICEILTR